MQTPISPFINSVGDYLSFRAAKRLRESRIPRTAPGSDAESKLIAELRDSHAELMRLRDEVKLRGDALARWLVERGEGARDVLAVLDCICGGGGPDGAYALWRDLKPRLQELVLRCEQAATMPARAPVHEDARMSAAEVAAAIDAPAETVRKRLERWRNANDRGWFDVPNPGPRDARVVYRWGDVKDAVSDLAGTVNLSGERPAK